MNEEKIINGYYQSNIKTSRNEHSVYAMKYASQQMIINKLQQENSQLKERIDKAIECIEKQKTKMYKNRNKIALFVLMKLEKILKRR